MIYPGNFFGIILKWCKQWKGADILSSQILFPGPDICCSDICNKNFVVQTTYKSPQYRQYKQMLFWNIQISFSFKCALDILSGKSIRHTVCSFKTESMGECLLYLDFLRIITLFHDISTDLTSEIHCISIETQVLLLVLFPFSIAVLPIKFSILVHCKYCRCCLLRLPSFLLGTCLTALAMDVSLSELFYLSVW